jgi:hypothetical protein
METTQPRVQGPQPAQFSAPAVQTGATGKTISAPSPWAPSYATEATERAETKQK